MELAPPKKMIKRSGRRRNRAFRPGIPLPPPPGTVPRPTEPSETTSEALLGAPTSIGRRPPQVKSQIVPKTIQSLHGQIEEWMTDAYTKMGASELVGQIPWGWNSKLTSTMGRAHYRSFVGVIKPTKIDLSSNLFKRATPEEQRQTVFHECAHIVDYHKGTYREGSAHGPSWKRYMLRAGLVPKRCHQVKPVGRVEVWCLCKTHYVTKKMFNKIRGGEIRRCLKCHSKITTVKPVGR